MTHEAPSRQHTGAIIAFTFLVLATIVFLLMQLEKKQARKLRRSAVLISQSCVTASLPLSHSLP